MSTPSRTLWRFLVGNGLLLAHGRDNCDQEFLAILEITRDAFPEVAVRDFDVVFRSPICSHEVEETVIDVHLRRAVRT